MKKMNFNKNATIVIFSLVCLISMASLTGCSYLAINNPILGVWSDNIGNTITIGKENDFTSNITTDIGKVSTKGTYLVNLDTIIFTDENDNVMRCTWDIIGNVLYLDWRDENMVSYSLALTHVEEENAE